MTSTLSASLAWALPVRPGLLGTNLEAYTKALPTLNALRLCHRFGKGPKAHLHKLPVEILQDIEQLILADTRASVSWSIDDYPGRAYEFECFQSQCAPSGHMSEATPWWDSIEDGLDHCETCAEEGVYDDGCEKRCAAKSDNPCKTCQAKPNSPDCERTCRAKLLNMANQNALECDLFWDDHGDSQASWMRRIANSKDDETMRKYFGLDVFYAHTRVDNNNPERWPKHENYQWHTMTPLQTTLCYLTLPQAQESKMVCEPSEMEADSGLFSMHCAQSVAMNPVSNHDPEKLPRRFNRALRLLGLRPELHASQQAILDAKNDATQWPKLLFLVRGQFDL